MCVGIPMRLLSRSGDAGLCAGANGPQPVDLSLVPEAEAGDHLLVFLGAARTRLDPEEAARIAEALAALSAVMAGEDPALIDRAFADLDREPQLPPHLAAAYAAGRKEA
ncbi:HypC/HybG/HupF family hydrogenase formation chaperone [Aquabacter sp. L1I39]|uniref:HypC/HybG/HupF family hydrogenase formation chaperone n=1 Tax=Aquabacter sp. L1I39 TaxID=2820278 RepID=UPI001ADBCA19|nr:HypC/HybG/HupF family hydrogenase formation chaperone [Aquabacter sp. L1I39]QTL04650.1 HypC/HybG/HupF family hydrogenase formation chaperone [Aquabacter sp. L1I39]